MELLVSHLRGCYGPAKQEIVCILRRLGDPRPHVEKSGVPGICVVRTELDNRNVIARCAELFRTGSESFRFAIKWVPVDDWCEKDLDAIRRFIVEKVAPLITARESWALKVEKRGWEQYHTDEIIRRLAEAIGGKVRLKAPDKLVHIDILANAVAISVLRPGETFSIHAPPP